MAAAQAARETAKALLGRTQLAKATVDALAPAAEHGANAASQF